MAALVESMMYVSNEANGRFVPWHGLGTAVEDAPNSKEALRLAGLDWEVEQRPIRVVDGVQIPGYVANVRKSDDSVLGIVTPKYKIVQNTQAFDFTDSLIGDDVRYETAGSLNDGKTIWLLAKLPTEKILDDDVDPYICFTNSHDGKGSIKVACVPIRVVCNNTLNLALKKASRTWATKHMGSMESKLDEAKRALNLTHEYMEELAVTADELANSGLSDTQTFAIIKNLFPINEDMSDREKNNMNTKRDQLMACMHAEDIKKFANTKWGFIQGVTDFVGHATPNRLTSTYQEKNWGNIIGGHAILDKAYDMVKAI